MSSSTRKFICMTLVVFSLVLSILLLCSQNYISTYSLPQMVPADTLTIRWALPENEQDEEAYPPLPPEYPSVPTKYPPISTKYPAPVDELWTRISESSHARRVSYYDNRANSWGGPVLITLTFHDTRINPWKRVYFTKVVYRNGTETCVSNAAARWREIRVPKDEKEKVMGNLLIFNLPTQEVPETMFISESSNCSNPSAYITVFYERPSDTPKLDFAVCLYQAMFNLNDHEAFAAWIEMNRQLGAQKIYVYFQNEPDSVKEVAQRYVEEGLVEAFDWNSDFTTEDDNNYGQAVLTVDCQYRSMYQTKYLLLYDMDEVIVPRQAGISTWHELMKQIDHHHRLSAFRFCVAYMHETGTTMPIMDSLLSKIGCSNVTDIPIMFKRTGRTANVNCELHRWKNIIKPLGVKYVGTHRVALADRHDMTVVPVEVGLMYHYRYFMYGQQLNEKIATDFTLLQYMENVITNLVQIFCRLAK